MEELIIAVLGGAIIYLWTRTSDLQRQIEWLKQLVEAEPAGAVAPAVQPRAPVIPARRVAEVPDQVAGARPVSGLEPPQTTQERAIEPEPELEPDAALPRQRFTMPQISLDLEDLFGRRLPIWAGGIALAVAGFFLVRYSIEAGLITPSVRVILGFAFGLALIAAAEAAFRFEGVIKDARVRQALAGAGLATLYASFYLAGSVYGLLGSTLSFIGLASVTAAAIALSFRFGLPCAVLGLVGGFAAPTLVGSEDANLPMLALYLSLVTAGLALTGKRQDRAWLGLASLGGALGWGIMLLMAGFDNAVDTLAVGGFLLLVGAAMPLLLAHENLRGFGRVAVAGLATLQMAALVDQANYSFLAWGLYALLAAGISVLGWNYPRMREGSAAAGATALWMLAIWPEPAARDFALIAAVFTAIFAVIPLVHLWRERHVAADLWQLSLFPLGILAAATWHFGADFGTFQAGLVAAALVLSTIPVAAAWKLWPESWLGQGEPVGRYGAIAISSAATGLFAAGILAVPLWAVPLVGALLAGGIAALGWNRAERAMANIGWGIASATLLACFVTVDDFAQLARMVGEGDGANRPRDLLRWFAVGVPFALLAAADRRRKPALLAEVLGALAGYAAFAQVVPAQYLAWTAAGAAGVAAWRLPARLPAPITFGAMAGLWALWPLGIWWLAGQAALAGIPMLAADLPSAQDVIRYILPAAAAAAVLLRFASIAPPVFRRGLLGLAAVLGVVTAHVLFKQIFAIGSSDQFRSFGLIERTLWESGLLAIGFGMWRLGQRQGSGHPGIAGQAIVAAAFAHFACFTLILHNPLWAQQWAGPWPIVNWLVPAYASALAAVILLRHSCRAAIGRAMPAFDAGLMVLLTLFALSQLRQLFAGGWLTSTPVGQAEDLLRSLLGIVLAIGFLLWGSRTGTRSWRIGSLVLMLGAVFKVFWFDTAALEGLIRVASMMALGFSLIGIGWFYSKQLARPAAPADEA